MKTIFNSKNNFIGIIGLQNYGSNIKYKEIPYLIKVQADEGWLWYNILTSEILLLSDNELKMLESKSGPIFSRLVRRWYYIPIDMDPKTISYAMKQKYLSVHPIRKNSPLTLAVVYTTSDCNAKCPYCFEQGTSRRTMTDEVAEATADYIVKHSASKILLKWFGGEPLLNTRPIDIICQKVGDAGIQYQSSIITNAYLFDKISDSKLVDAWHTKHLQITIDGTRNVYIQTKRLPDDSYDKALDAISRAASLEITTMLRTHITDNNLDDLKSLIYELCDRYKDLGDKRRYIHLYTHPIFEYVTGIIDKENQEKIYNNFIELDKLISKTNLDHGRYVQSIKCCHCMADNGRSIVVSPLGDITPCEHYHDAEIVGNVWDGHKVPDSWFEYYPDIPECRECFLYPQCIRLRKCATDLSCNEDSRRYLRHRHELIAIKTYKRYLAGKEAPANSVRRIDSVSSKRSRI